MDLYGIVNCSRVLLSNATYMDLGNFAQKFGITWGGTFRKYDGDHFELSGFNYRSLINAPTNSGGWVIRP